MRIRKTHAATILFTIAVYAQPRAEIARQPTLYVVPYAHLDTQWNWDLKTTIAEYLPKTMRVNFDYFEKYPHYIFNFTGANRYRLMKEYYPADFAKLKQYVAAGRWFPGGSSMEEGDVNAPSAEAILRQILYGNTWFRREFGKSSAEYMLPDCFGFPASLPSIMAHAGIKGFSTQKLSSMWQPAPRVGGPDSPEKTPEGIPFNVGIWEGPDGKTVIAALNPLAYQSAVDYDLSKTPPPAPATPAAPGGPGGRGFGGRGFGGPGAREDWPKRIQINGDLTGIYADYHYIGTGDTGGAVNEQSVRLLEAILTKGMGVIPPPRQFGGRVAPPAADQPSSSPVQVGDGPVRVVVGNSDQMFKDILECCSTARMPRYKGDLELINHSAGELTSQAYHKRWNRQNEILADAAEKASVAAAWLGGAAYPQQALNDAWTLVLGGHFHDTMAGTASPSSYELAWNDAVIALNRFSSIITQATATVASAMNTETKGIPLVVYNPLSIDREDVVEATVDFPGGPPRAVRVIGPDGKETPSQLERGKVIFIARVPATGFAVYGVEAANQPARTALKVTESILENARYRLRLDANGDVSSVFDKAIGKELLSSPIRLAFQTEKPAQFPAWNMDWADQQKPPRGYVQGVVKVRIVENGAARVAIAVERETEGSKFVQTIRLAAGDAGNRIEFANAIDWKTGEAALKATFPLAAANPEATYNWDIGTVRRHNNEERQFEVASHQWIDLTDKSGEFGATLLTDAKNGSDKPDDRTLRLTLLYTPGIRGGGFSYQGSQDWGHHEFVFGLAGHKGDWRQEHTDWQGYRLNQPLIAFTTTGHSGGLGREFSFLKVSNPGVRVLAVKKAEESDEIVVRVVETSGEKAAGVRLRFASPVKEAREINGQEQPLGAATVQNGELVADVGVFEPKSFAVRLAEPRARAAATSSQPLTLSYDRTVASRDGEKPQQGFDNQRNALPAEMLPGQIPFGAIRFRLGPAGGRNAVTARGQSIPLPPGKFNRIYVLAASADGDQKAVFRAGSRSAELVVPDWGGFVGQWDDHIYEIKPQPPGGRGGGFQPPPGFEPPPGGFGGPPGGGGMGPMGMGGVYEYKGLRQGFVKQTPIAWFASHHHTSEGDNAPYSYSYLFSLEMEIAPGTGALILPDNSKIRILAVTVAEEPAPVRAAQPMFDTLERR